VYRPEDWDSSDLPRIKAHLATCPGCRHVQEDFRQTGAAIRHLPTLTPPPEFRAAVMAAIREEARNQAPTLAEISRAVTNPEMPALPRLSRVAIRRGSGDVITPLRRSSARSVSARVALLAAAAVLLVSLIGARLISMLGPSALGGSAENLSNALQQHTTRYPLAGGYTLPTSAMATASWLVYTASNANQQTMIFAENRQSRRVMRLLPVPASATLTVRALTDRWVIWSLGTGTSSAPWRLYASSLTDAGAAAPLLLVDSTSTSPTTPVTLGGVWSGNDSVLVAGAPRSGAGELVKFDLSSGTPTSSVICHGQTSGDVLTDPTFDNGRYYWADVWFDSASGLHSSIWQGDDLGRDQQISQDQASFHPQVQSQTLVWVDVALSNLRQLAGTVGTITPDRDLQMLSVLSGTLDERNLGTGQEWQVSDAAEVPSIEVAGTLMLWQNGTRFHASSLNAGSLLPADSELQPATFASITGSTLVWTESSARDIFVYNAAA